MVMSSFTPICDDCGEEPPIAALQKAIIMTIFSSNTCSQITNDGVDKAP